MVVKNMYERECYNVGNDNQYHWYHCDSNRNYCHINRYLQEEMILFSTLKKQPPFTCKVPVVAFLM